MAGDDMENKEDGRRRISYVPYRDPLSLALMPGEALQGEEGRKKILAGMRGVEKHVVEELDGFGYIPTHTAYLDINLVILASGLGNLPLVRYWIEDLKIDPNVRNGSFFTALVQAIAMGQNEVRDYLLSVDGIEIGLPEAAALKLRDRIPLLVKEYDASPHGDRKYNLTGDDVAFIFSGLSGDIDWVLSLMDKASNVNVGEDCETGNVGMMAVRSGNTLLVRKLLQDYHVILETPYSPDILFGGTIRNTDMIRFLVEELKISSLDAIAEGSRCNLMESALLNRCTGTVGYLLSRRSAEAWSYHSHGQLLHHSIFLFNSPRISKRMLPSVGPWCVQGALRQALQYGDIATARALVDGMGGNLSEMKEDYATMLEIAVCSGSLETVNYVIKNQDRESLSYKHKNGYNALVAAARQGNQLVFDEVMQKLPEYLNALVWNGMSLLMVACQNLSNDVVDFLLREDFYESKCRGKELDANATCENGRTSLWYAVKSGYVANVDKLLSMRDWLGLKELDDQTKVNDLFVCAAQSVRFSELLDCFSRHSLAINGLPSSSLAMTAAEKGSLFVVDPKELQRLRGLDEAAGLGLSDEVLLCAIIRHSPDWAVDKGCLAHLINVAFADKEAMNSLAALEQAILRCDCGTVAQFNEATQLSALSATAELIVRALKNAKVSEMKRVPHPNVIHRRSSFMQWIIRNKKKLQGGGESLIDQGHAYEVLRAVVAADLDISSIAAEVAKPAHCSTEQLSSLMHLATKNCHLGNAQLLFGALASGTNLSSLNGEKEGTLIHTALSNGKVSDTGRKNRLRLVQWLSQSKIDFSCADDEDGENVVMSAAKLGDAHIFNWIAEGNKDQLAAQDKNGKSLVAYAVDGGHLEIVERAIAIGGSGTCGQNGETPLHLAAATGKLSLLRYLVEFVKVDISARDTINRTALDYSMFGNDPSSRDYLSLVLGASSDSDQSPSPRRTVHDWLDELSRKFGKQLGLNSQGICAFKYEDHTIVIEVPESVGSLFIYASFDQSSFAVGQDSWRMLLANIVPGANIPLCASLEKKSHCDDKGDANVFVSVTRRIEDLNLSGFRSLLEKFIDEVLATAGRLQICAARRYLSQVLSRSSSVGDNGSCIDAVLEHINTFAVDPPKVPSLSNRDFELFRQSLTPHVDELNRAIGKRLSLNQRGQFAFNYQHLTISVKPASDQSMLITSALWETSSDGPVTVELLKRALQLNYLQQETRGGLLSMFGSKGRDFCIFFMYSDHACVSTYAFRNILENFIDTALDLHGRLRKPLQRADVYLERDLRQRKATIINEIRNRDGTILERIFSLDDASMIENNIDSLAVTIMDTRDMDLWRFLAAAILSAARKHPNTDVNSFRKLVFKRACEKAMVDGDLLGTIMDSAPDTFELDNLGVVFASAELLQDARTAATAEAVVELHRTRCLERNESPPDQILNDWYILAVNAMSVYQRRSNADEVIACLEWIFSKTKHGELDASSKIVGLLHHAASQGCLKVVQFLLHRLPHLSLDEETLLWACMHNHLDLAVFIISRSDNLPRARAVLAAAASGSVDLLKALKIGTKDDERLEDTERKELGKAIADAARTAMAKSNWAVLKHALTDHRLKMPLAQLLREASICAFPKAAILSLLSSSYAAQQEFSCRIPWQAQALVMDVYALKLLRVVTACHLPGEVGAIIWLFLRPECEASPLVLSSSDFWEKYRTPLERDLGIAKIDRDGDAFVLPGIGRLSIWSGQCCVKRRFNTSGIVIRPDAILAMSAQLGGCFLAAADLDLALFLKRCVPLDDSFSYNELRLILRSFCRVTKIVDEVLSYARKYSVMVPALDLPAIAPSICVMNKIRAEAVVRKNGSSFVFSYFTDTKWIRISSSQTEPNIDFKKLLEMNMASTTDETFFCMDGDGNVCAAMYILPYKVDDGCCLNKLVAKCGGL